MMRLNITEDKHKKVKINKIKQMTSTAQFTYMDHLQETKQHCASVRYLASDYANYTL